MAFSGNRSNSDLHRRKLSFLGFGVSTKNYFILFFFSIEAASVFLNKYLLINYKSDV